MSTRQFIIGTVIATMTLEGCIGSYTRSRSIQRSTQLNEDRDRVIRAARQYLTANGWVNVHQRDHGHRLSAVQPTRNGVRELVVLEVKETGEVLVWVRTQMTDGTGRWLPPSSFCDASSGSRERLIVEGILDSTLDRSAQALR